MPALQRQWQQSGPPVTPQHSKRSRHKQLRVAFSKATAEIARSSEELTSAMERRLDHFADVLQRAQATFTALSEYVTVQT
jgi:hypothetical protein